MQTPRLKYWNQKILKTKNMAETKGFDGLEPIFGESTLELEQGEALGGVSRSSILFYIHSLDSSRLEIVASDFHSNTFKNVLTIIDIDDLVIALSFPSFVQFEIAMWNWRSFRFGPLFPSLAD